MSQKEKNEWTEEASELFPTETNEAEEAVENTPQQPKWLQVWLFFRPTVICCIVILVITQFFIMYANVPSGSMENTIMTGSMIIANRRSYDINQPERGDIIIFTTDQSENKYLVKRIIGLEGDVIELKNGSVYLNGSKQEEAYVTSATFPLNSRSRFEVPEGCVFVMGDNRTYSADARMWNDPYLPVKNIKGKVFGTFSFLKWYFHWLG